MREELQNKLNAVNDALISERDEHARTRKSTEVSRTDIEKLREELHDAERQTDIARKHADELDAQLKGTQARQATLENELQAARKEVDAIAELNARLQRERQEAQK